MQFPYNMIFITYGGINDRQNYTLYCSSKLRNPKLRQSVSIVKTRNGHKEAVQLFNVVIGQQVSFFNIK